MDEKQEEKEVYVRILQLLQGAQHAEAERLCNLILKTDDALNYLPWFYLGVARQLQGKIREALEAFQKAHTIKPNDIEVINASASCYEQLERHSEAYETMQEAYKIAPGNAAVCANLGAALERLEKFDEALTYYDSALSIDHKNLLALTNRGTLLTRLGRRQEGLAHNREAHVASPEVFGLLYNLVDALIGMFQYDEALAYCDAGLAWMPRHAYMMFKKGMVLSCLQRFEEAQKYLSLAQIIEPRVIKDMLPHLRLYAANVSVHVDARLLYFEAMYQEQACCFWRDRAGYIKTLNDTIQATNSPYTLVHTPTFGFSSFSLEIDANARLKLAKNIGDHVRDLVWLSGFPPFTFKHHKRKRLRIGHVSPDFRKHPVGYLSRQIYSLHDRTKFEVYAYSLFNKNPDDEIYQDIKKACDVFREVDALSTFELAELIHKDEIDILVDLTGYTTHGRPETIALRPAPVQILQNGYLEGMGGGIVDYVVTDAHVYPDGGDNFWHEAAIRLPHHTLPYDNKVDNAATGAKRSDYGLSDEATFVFCCLNNSYKIEPGIFGVWMNILKAVPGSVLWLFGKSEQVMINLRNEARMAGVESSRLIFAPHLPSIAEYCLRFQVADLFLDTLWHNAQTTALDALWQGLPLLTREGNSVSSRAAASCLRVLDMPELITKDVAEYERKATYYAKNPAELTALREKLKLKRATSPLFDSVLMVRHLEYAYEAVWQRYQAGLPPATIDVPDLTEAKH